MIKKSLFFFATVFILTSFSPAKDDIVGYWEIVKVESSFEMSKRRNKKIRTGFLLQFRADGVVISGRRIDKKKETKSGTYNFNEEKMTLEIKDVGPRNDEPMKVVKLTKTKLIFRDKNSTIHFKRIKA